MYVGVMYDPVLGDFIVRYWLEQRPDLGPVSLSDSVTTICQAKYNEERI